MEIKTLYRVVDGRMVPLNLDQTWYTEPSEAIAAARPREFIVGKSYQWSGKRETPHHMGRRHGPLKCIHIGSYQGLFESEPSPAGAFENRNGLHIVALGHLHSGDFIQLD